MAFANPAAADDEPGFKFNLAPVELRMTFDVASSFQSVQNAQHGIGSVGRDGVRRGGRQWSEFFFKPGLEFEWGSFDYGEAYGKASVVGTATRGAGEAGAASTTSDRPEHLAINDLAAGWRSGPLFDSVLPPNGLDVSFGNQEFAVGDGFLIVNGTLDGGGRAAYYLGPRNVFERTAIVRLNTEPVRADFFRLEAGVDQKLMHGGDNPVTKLHGVNLEWFASKGNDEGRREYDQRKWYVALTYIKVFAADVAFSFAGADGASLAGNRDGLSVYSLRAGGAFLSSVPDLKLFGEWALERNSNGATGGSVRAGAWYAQPQYTFSQLPWKPSLTWRYAHFSGDADTTDTIDRSWDPLYSDAGARGATTWTQGQIFSQYVGANSNLDTHHLGLDIEPIADTLKAGFAYFHHDFDRPSQVGARSRRLMDEYDVWLEWTTPVAGVTVSPGLGLGRPGAGQKQALGTTDANNRTIWLGQLIMTYEF